MSLILMVFKLTILPLFGKRMDLARRFSHKSDLHVSLLGLFLTFCPSHYRVSHTAHLAFRITLYNVLRFLLCRLSDKNRLFSRLPSVTSVLMAIHYLIFLETPLRLISLTLCWWWCRRDSSWTKCGFDNFFTFSEIAILGTLASTAAISHRNHSFQTDPNRRHFVYARNNRKHIIKEAKSLLTECGTV